MSKFLLSMFGDGAGQISSLRVLSAVVVGAVVATKFYNAWLTRSAVVWDTQDLTLIGAVLGAKLVQNLQEQGGAAVTPPAAPVREVLADGTGPRATRSHS